MKDRRWTLLYQDVVVGRVAQTGADFPRCVGTVVVVDDIAETSPLVARFVELSGAASRIEDGWDGISEYPESPELRECGEHFERLDPDGWWFVAADGTREAIVCPNIRHDDVIIWAWDVLRKTD